MSGEVAIGTAAVHIQVLSTKTIRLLDKFIKKADKKLNAAIKKANKGKSQKSVIKGIGKVMKELRLAQIALQ